jgi:hypothetical protein
VVALVALAVPVASPVVAEAPGSSFIEPVYPLQKD